MFERGKIVTDSVMPKWIILFLLLLYCPSSLSAAPSLSEIRTASNTVLTVVFTDEINAPNDYNGWIKTKIDVNAVDTSDLSRWKLNGVQPSAIHKFVTESSATCESPKGAEHRIYLEVPQLVNEREYKLGTLEDFRRFTPQVELVQVAVHAPEPEVTRR